MTIDSMQGREFDVVFLSLVRNNPEGKLGFLVDPRRANVALSRAVRSVVVLGSAATINCFVQNSARKCKDSEKPHFKGEVWGAFLSYCKSDGGGSADRSFMDIAEVLSELPASHDWPTSWR